MPKSTAAASAVPLPEFDQIAKRIWPAPIEWSGLSLMHCGPVGRI